MNEQSEAARMNGTVHSFVLLHRLVRWRWDKRGWWLTDSNEFRNTMVCALLHITAPDGWTGKTLAIGPLMIQWGNIRQNAGVSIPGDEPGYAPRECSCRHCNPNAWWMVVCSMCGNKRCPHAKDHRLECTNSNEPNQQGSIYSTNKEV